MEARQGSPRNESETPPSGVAGRLVRGAAWTTGLAVIVTALALFALFACKTAGH